jgi:N12 class adenine-specific DNA methylase
MAQRRTPATKERKKRDKRKRAQRKLLGEAISKTIAEAPDQGRTDPVEALQIVLDRTYSWLVYVAKKTGELPEEDLWRKTKGVGKIPNEWVRLERDLRNELAYLSARMLDRDIETRWAQAAEIVATAIAPVLEGILSDLKLTKKQRARAKRVVQSHLQMIEGGARTLTEVDEEDE